MAKTSAVEQPELAHYLAADAAPENSGGILLPQAIAYWALWPLGLLMVGEVAAIVFFAPPHDVHLIPVLFAFATLLAGILPALLRPSVPTKLVACIAVALASIFWRAQLDSQDIPSLLADAIAKLTTNETKVIVANTALLSPLMLHLSMRFPRPNFSATRWLVGHYGLIGGILVLAYVAPAETRLSILACLILAVYAGLIVAGYQFLRTIQHVEPLYPHAAQQARLLLCSFVLAQAPLFLLPVGSLLNIPISPYLLLGTQIILPAGIAYTIVRHELFGIDATLRRAAVYTAVSFGLLVIYFGLTTLLTRITSEKSGTWAVTVTILSVLATAAAFRPLHRIMQRLIDRAFYPERLAFSQIVGVARDSLAHITQRTGIVALLEDTVPKQLDAAWGKLVLQPPFAPLVGARHKGVWRTQLNVGEQMLGSYWLGPRNSGLLYTADEQEQLRSLAQQVAFALAHADIFESLEQLNRELESQVAARTAHVLAQQRELAAMEERQRIARDLHDSVKQTLFSIGLGVRSASGAVRSDPNEAIALLDEQERIALQAQVDMRQLLAQLRTPAANSTDIVDLLTQHCQRLSQQHGMQVMPHMPPALVLPELLSRELVQIAKEALHNVLRHSGTNQAELELAINAADQHTLTLQISDRGRGFDLTVPREGYGLRGMHERVAALGGAMRIESAPEKGTTLWVQINLTKWKPSPLQRSGL